MLGVILAGGEGRRFSRAGCCKPLLKINGRYLIEYSLDHLAALGVGEALIVVGKYGREIAAALGDAYRGVKLRYVRQPQPLGLVNALYTACAGISGRDVILMLGDELLLGLSLSAARRPAEADFLCGYTVPEDPAMIRENYAVLCRADGTLLSTVEKPVAALSNKKGTGFCVFSAGCIDVLRSAYAAGEGAGRELCDYINLLLAGGRRGLAVRIAREEININDPARLRYAVRRMAEEAAV